MSRSPSFHRRRPMVVVLSLALGWSGQWVYAQGLEEVIVTAQKREEGLQDVPIAVEASSAPQLEAT